MKISEKQLLATILATSALCLTGAKASHADLPLPPGPSQTTSTTTVIVTGRAIAALSITKNSDIDFGQIVNISGGTASSDGQTTGNVKIVNKALQKSGKFTLRGEPEYAVNLSIPPQVTMQSESSHSMLVDLTPSINSTPTVSSAMGNGITNTILPVSGEEVVTVIATAHLAPDTAPGNYSGQFQVMAWY